MYQGSSTELGNGDVVHQSFYTLANAYPHLGTRYSWTTISLKAKNEHFLDGAILDWPPF
jgi:hypothetical protein